MNISVIQRFGRTHKIGSYFGVVPCQDASADRNRLGHITGEGQLGLFADPEREKQQKIDAATDAISAKFGKGAIRRGGSMEGRA